MSIGGRSLGEFSAEANGGRYHRYGESSDDTTVGYGEEIADDVSGLCMAATWGRWKVDILRSAGTTPPTQLAHVLSAPHPSHA